VRALLLVLLVTLLTACGSDAAGGGATPENASVAIMGQRLSDLSDPDQPPRYERYPECMGVAVSPTTILTAAHCEPVGSSFLIVDAPTWQRTSSGVAFADLAFDAGEVRTLVPRQPLLNWALPAAAADGPAVFVVIRGSDFVALPTVLTGDRMTGDVEHGDSGAGVFQSGRLVGLTQACTAPDDVTCSGGGRFSPVP